MSLGGGPIVAHKISVMAQCIVTHGALADRTWQFLSVERERINYGCAGRALITGISLKCANRLVAFILQLAFYKSL